MSWCPCSPSPEKVVTPERNRVKDKKAGNEVVVAPPNQRIRRTKEGQAQKFKFKQLVFATGQFKLDSFIGEGGFGRVYKGFLNDIGKHVAVKQLNPAGLQGDREFVTEVQMLTSLDHPNLVKLIGYCSAGTHRLLVYEYMPLGSLEDHLYDISPPRKALSWQTRMSIAYGAAKGLEYLHDIAKPPVIHRDLKPSNILLGEGYFPKLSDFGLAKIGPVGDQTHVSTRVLGTYGFCATEYIMTGQLTTKSDIFSFGVLLLVLITGRRAIQSNERGKERTLVEWATPLFKDPRNIHMFADPFMQGQYPSKALYQAVSVAAICVRENAAERPVIGDVVIALQHLALQSESPTPQRSPYLSRTVGGSSDVHQEHMRDPAVRLNNELMEPPSHSF